LRIKEQEKRLTLNEHDDDDDDDENILPEIEARRMRWRGTRHVWGEDKRIEGSGGQNPRERNRLGK
jgi:hypothetical protein